MVENEKYVKIATGSLFSLVATSALRPLIRVAYKAEECVLAVSYICVISISHCLMPFKPLIAILYNICDLHIVLYPPLGLPKHILSDTSCWWARRGL